MVYIFKEYKVEYFHFNDGALIYKVTFTIWLEVLLFHLLY